MLLHFIIEDPWMSILVHGIISVLAVLWIHRFCKASSFTVGVPICYVLLLSILHFGAWIYLLPWYDPTTDPYLRAQLLNIDEVAKGYSLTVLGIVSFACGVYLSDKLFHGRKAVEKIDLRQLVGLGRSLVVIGAVCFFIIFPISGRIPSGAAIASAGANLSIVGLCILTFYSLKQASSVNLRVLTATLTLPSITMLFLGFVGYGVSALLQIFSFMFSFVRIRFWHWPLALFAFWFALSFYVTYMAGRAEIRDVVWRGASFTDRIQVVYERALLAQSFDPSNIKHLHTIDTRLNQNSLVGRCVDYLDTTHKEHANGATIYLAAVAWIPRIIWPSKPTFGGSGSLVSDFTGISFSENTSVGVGQVLEFYINFGQLGVMVGFVLMGLFIRYLDRNAALHLRSGEYLQYATFHLIGICALQPGGMLAEVVASSAAAWLLMFVTRKYIVLQAAQPVATHP